MGPAQNTRSAASSSSKSASPSALSSISSPSSSMSSSVPMPTPSATQHSLPADIPHLNRQGANWATFFNKFHCYMIIHDHWPYLDGTLTHPTSADPAKPMDVEKQDGIKWDKEDSITSYLLSQRIPDDISNEIEALTTSKQQWDAVCGKFKPKSEYAKTDLHQSFLDMKCPKGGDVREFLDGLRSRRHHLCAIGVNVTDTQYQRTILRCIPDSLAAFASQMHNSLDIASSY